MRLSTALLAATFMVAASASAAFAAPNLVTNGSFSNVSGGITTSTQFGSTAPAGQFVTGWTGNNGYAIWFPNATASTTENASGVYQGSGREKLWAATPSPDGGAFVGLDGDSTVRASISQTISNLIVGNTYQVSFDWAAGQLQSRTGATTEQVQVTFGSASQTTNLVHNPSEGFTGWYNQVFDFTATSTSQLLTFLSLGQPTGLPPMALLDGVSVTAVPEPSSIALLGAGLIGLGLVGRRRLRRRAASNV